jgi:membrane associated rhomboid family serine protease
VSTGGPDLFVVCKSCGAEVSSYITECPYCGNRLRKRAPKLDREGKVATPKPRRRSTPPLLTRLRQDEIPGIRPDRRAYGTAALVIAGLIGTLLWRTGLGGANDIEVFGKPGAQWWRVFTAAFVYDNSGYAILTLGAIGLFGYLLERRHGPLVVIALFLLGGVGGVAATAAIYPFPFALGADGAALAMLTAWAIPDLLALRARADYEADLLGVAVIAVVLALMPLAVYGASWPAVGVGVIAGLLVGLPLSRLGPR